MGRLPPRVGTLRTVTDTVRPIRSCGALQLVQPGRCRGRSFAGNPLQIQRDVRTRWPQHSGVDAAAMNSSPGIIARTLEPLAESFRDNVLDCSHESRAHSHGSHRRIRTPVRAPADRHAGTGLGRSTIYRLVASGAFPAPVHVGPRAVAWRWSDLDRWSETRQPGRYPLIPRAARRVKGGRSQAPAHP